MKENYPELPKVKRAKRKRTVLGMLFVLCLAVFFGYTVLVGVKQYRMITGEIRDTFEGHYLAGLSYANDAAWNEAAKQFKAALDFEPRDLILMDQTIDYLVLAGEFKEAVNLAKTQSEYGKISVLSSLVLAVHNIDQGDYLGASRALAEKKVVFGKLTAPSRNVIVITAILQPFLASVLTVETSKNIDAVDQLKAILGKNINSENQRFIHYFLGNLYELKHRSKDAETYYQKALESEEQPYHFVRSLAEFYIREGQIAKAQGLLRVFRRANAQNDLLRPMLESLERGDIPYLTPLSSKQLVITLLKEGVRMAYQSDLSREGLLFLQLERVLDPDSDESKLLLADYYEENHFNQEAVDIVESIDQDSEFYDQARLSHARNLYALGKKNQAETILLNFHKDHPTQYLAGMALGDLYRMDKRFDDAARMYQEVTKRITNPQTEQAIIYFLKGIAFERAGKWPQAEAALQQALKLDPKQPEVLNYLGYSWVDRNVHVKEAQAMIDQADYLQPDDPHIMDSVGWALYKRGEYHEAVDYLERAIAELPYDPIVNEHLGDAYAKTGRKLEASYQYQRALENDPDPKRIEDLKQKLNQVK